MQWGASAFYMVRGEKRRKIGMKELIFKFISYSLKK